jgi:hypothetical protein
MGEMGGVILCASKEILVRKTAKSRGEPSLFSEF